MTVPNEHVPLCCNKFYLNSKNIGLTAISIIFPFFTIELGTYESGFRDTVKNIFLSVFSEFCYYSQIFFLKGQNSIIFSGEL